MKKLWSLLLAIIMLFSLSACGGKSDTELREERENFIRCVEEYEIFDDNNSYGMKTVGDFIEKMESFEKERTLTHRVVTINWSQEELEENDKLIKSIKKENSNFVFDEDKHYRTLSVTFEIINNVGDKTLENHTDVFLFSMDDNEKITPEGYAYHQNSSYNYEYISVGVSSFLMHSRVLFTELVVRPYDSVNDEYDKEFN